MKQGPDQIALPLDWPQSEGDARFIASQANREAFDHFRQWSMWPVKATILTGPRRSGRTLLARSFVERVGGRLFDDADQRDEEELFHAWNQAQDVGRPVVMVADAVPPAWSPQLPDLQTRLAVTPVVRIGHPDDELFPALPGSKASPTPSPGRSACRSRDSWPHPGASPNGRPGAPRRHSRPCTRRGPQARRAARP